MWLSYLKVDTTAGALKHDLAVDASGQGTPSRMAAGLSLGETGGAGTMPVEVGGDGFQRFLWPAVALLGVAAVALVAIGLGRIARR
jgi:hypothetical protein